jgi:hypothetical protein
MSNLSNIAVIACGVIEPEVRHFVNGAMHIMELVFLPQGLHDDPARMQRELQAAIDRAEANPRVEAIVLVYGLCSRGIENLRHDRCPLVITRAHDCVTLFLGDKDRYTAYQQANPGTYWYNPGWIRGGASPGPDREARLRKEYAEKFGADDVDYLIETDRESLAHYQARGLRRPGPRRSVARGGLHQDLRRLPRLGLRPRPGRPRAAQGAAVLRLGRKTLSHRAAPARHPPHGRRRHHPRRTCSRQQLMNTCLHLDTPDGHTTLGLNAADARLPLSELLAHRGHRSTRAAAAAASAAAARSGCGPARSSARRTAPASDPPPMTGSAPASCGCPRAARRR